MVEIPAATERRQQARPDRKARSLPVLRLLLYYALLVGLGLAIAWFVPNGSHAIAAPFATGGGDGLITGQSSAGGAPVAPAPWSGEYGRLLLAFIAVFGALAIALPVAWVYMFTRRLRYSPSLVQTMVMLPMVVAGVVLVVKNSLALAFALAGIVAGVRFRQKLSEPKEAVYVLLALGVGLAAGVQALDIALAVSLAFNVVALVLWRWDVGSLEPRRSVPLLAVGDTRALVRDSRAERREAHARAVSVAGDMSTDGILIVLAEDAEAARHGVEVSLVGVAKEWRLTRPVPAAGGLSRFEVLLRLQDKADPLELLGELEERWGAQVRAAEYIPFRRRGKAE
ncbi:MAG TPA: DUF4956 domain-containing protein [Longimicrobiales bacterium]|nr:DUF4956 domain-containing protein [Longimicrobiales bacterium]